MIVLAHAGHWLVDLLYVAPLIVLGGLMIAGKVRERRAGRGRKSDGLSP